MTVAILKWKSWESTGAESCARTALARADGPYQPVDAVFGARQHCCVQWAALVDADGVRDASKAPANRLATFEEVDGTTTNRIFYSRSFEKDLQLRMEVLALATDGEERVPMEGRHLNVVKSFVS